MLKITPILISSLFAAFAFSADCYIAMNFCTE